ncbi:hypothetical protein MRB53_018371 [Persea americana]|uniref:Uncharacterized protein n=1 Tax=Persea americana TaxID=3435 RepID=A0ACC2M7P4_PERAE|nr:hypothetical protein MRB53_018371 [Persea americana]
MAGRQLVPRVESKSKAYKKGSVPSPLLVVARTDPRLSGDPLKKSSTTTQRGKAKDPRVRCLLLSTPPSQIYE